MSVDWGLVRIQFEVFGESIETLAEEFDVRPRAIKYASEEGNWSVLPVGRAAREWTGLDSIEEISDDLLEKIQERHDILFTMKQAALIPRYIKLEAAILGKAIEVVENVSADHPGAAGNLKMASDILSSLREKSGLRSDNGKAAGEGRTGVTVQIMGQVGDRAGSTAIMGAKVEITEHV